MKILLGMILLLCLPLAQAANKVVLFNEGLNAASHHQWQKLGQIVGELGKGYPLTVYLDYAKLVQQLPAVSPSAITDFQQHYQHSPLVSRLQSRALSAYSAADHWQAFLVLADSPPSSLSRRCDYIQALLHTNSRDKAMEMVPRLLQDNRAMPASCRTLLTHLHKAAVLADDAVMRLMRHAFRHYQQNWMQTLASWLPDDNTDSKWLITLYTSPEQLGMIPESLASRQALLFLGLWKLARRNPDKALDWWQRLSSASLGGKSARQQLAGRIAWYSAIRRAQPNRQWLDSWLAKHPHASTVEQRARHAIMEQNWKDLLYWEGYLPVSRQQSAHWTYWKARALEALGKSKQAGPLYKKAATVRSFYGFLAADRLGRSYQLNNNAKPTQAQLHLSTQQTLALSRVRLLLKAGQNRDARREWSSLLARVSQTDRLALGRYAQLKRWYNFAIAAAARAGQHDRLAWRFPLAWQSVFQQAAAKYSPDNAFLMMAVARRESAFFPAAVSRVGAQGLMQLMPATAKSVVARHDGQLAYNDIFNVDANLTLGSAYLGYLLNDFQGNRVLSLASYNAGPSRVKSWLGDEPVTADVWIAGIPFHETRAYVKAVLAYRVIFMCRAGVAEKQIHLLGDTAKEFAYTKQALKHLQQESVASR